MYLKSTWTMEHRTIFSQLVTGQAFRFSGQSDTWVYIGSGRYARPYHGKCFYFYTKLESDTSDVFVRAG